MKKNVWSYQKVKNDNDFMRIIKQRNLEYKNRNEIYKDFSYKDFARKMFSIYRKKEIQMETKKEMIKKAVAEASGKIQFAILKYDEMEGKSNNEIYKQNKLITILLTLQEVFDIEQEAIYQLNETEII